MPLVLVLGPVLDLLFFAMLSRHRMAWLALALTVACAFSLYGGMAGHAASASIELLGGSR
jgi:hypothetical protein